MLLGGRAVEDGGAVHGNALFDPEINFHRMFLSARNEFSFL